MFFQKLILFVGFLVLVWFLGNKFLVKKGDSVGDGIADSIHERTSKKKEELSKIKSERRALNDEIVVTECMVCETDELGDSRETLNDLDESLVHKKGEERNET